MSSGSMQLLKEFSSYEQISIQLANVATRPHPVRNVTGQVRQTSTYNCQESVSNAAASGNAATDVAVGAILVTAMADSGAVNKGAASQVGCWVFANQASLGAGSEESNTGK